MIALATLEDCRGERVWQAAGVPSAATGEAVAAEGGLVALQERRLHGGQHEHLVLEQVVPHAGVGRGVVGVALGHLHLEVHRPGMALGLHPALARQSSGADVVRRAHAAGPGHHRACRWMCP
jgi:hypothetical protein